MIKSSACAILASVAVLAFVPSAFSQTPSGADVTEEIQAFCNQYDTLWTQKGAAAVAPLYTENAIFVAGDGTVVKGREAIAKLFADIYKEPTTHKCTVETARAEGNAAWSVAEVTVTGKPAGHVRAGAAEIKQNGEWKLQMVTVAPIQEKK